MEETKAALQRSLGGQRGHVCGILEGLDAEALRRPVLPTGWSCAGLIQHLALDVERFWFRAVLAGEQAVWEGFGDGDASAWQLADDTDPQSVIALYRDEVRLADEVITAMSLDAPPARWPEELFGDFRLPDLQAVLLHVLTETSTHAGHLDAARELIDGRTWMVL
ncbi:MAG: DinB family protein [Pseudonocardiales bacterium]